MFQSDLNKILDKGEITLRSRHRFGRNSYRGDRVEDTVALLECINRGSFYEDEFDSVLHAVANRFAVGLCVIDQPEIT